MKAQRKQAVQTLGKFLTHRCVINIMTDRSSPRLGPRVGRSRPQLRRKSTKHSSLGDTNPDTNLSSSSTSFVTEPRDTIPCPKRRILVCFSLYTTGLQPFPDPGLAAENAIWNFPTGARCDSQFSITRWAKARPIARGRSIWWFAGREGVHDRK